MQRSQRKEKIIAKNAKEEEIVEIELVIGERVGYKEIIVSINDWLGWL
jgi:hypothetical protein